MGTGRTTVGTAGAGGDCGDGGRVAAGMGGMKAGTRTETHRGRWTLPRASGEGQGSLTKGRVPVPCFPYIFKYLLVYRLF